MKLEGLSHITLAVRDLERSKAFYSEILQAELISETEEKDCHLQIGDLWLVLVKDESANPARGYSHIAFKADKGEFANWLKKIEASNAKIWQENRTFGDSIYFEDPDGHQLEIHTSTWQERFLEEGGGNA